MLKKRYILGIVLLLLIAVSVTTATEVSAAKYKKFDNGTKVGGYNKNGQKFSIFWAAYSNGNYVKTTCNFYKKPPGSNKKIKFAYMKTVLTKISKNKVKYTITSNLYGPKTIERHTEKTKLSAKAYYIKQIKSAYKSFTL